MAQFKKDEIKQKIDQAALEVFAKKGYKEAKIADIAEKSGLSVGNIYRYYGGKDDLFYSVLPDTFIIEVKTLLKRKIEESSSKQIKLREIKEVMSKEDEAFFLFLFENKERILMLFRDERQTYENIRKELIEYCIATIKACYTSRDVLEKLNEIEYYFILNCIYENLLLMLLGVLERGKSFGEVKQLVSVMNQYHLLGVSGLFKDTPL